MSKEKDRCHKTTHYEQTSKKALITRIHRIKGQVEGIEKTIDNERHCDDVIIQISAVYKALKSLGEEMLLNHMKTCMIDDIKNEHYETVEEVMDLCRRLV